jgi:hypothetical protein
VYDLQFGVVLMLQKLNKPTNNTSIHYALDGRILFHREKFAEQSNTLGLMLRTSRVDT